VNWAVGSLPKNASNDSNNGLQKANKQLLWITKGAAYLLFSKLNRL
jgi:hypothetical protein